MSEANVSYCLMCGKLVMSPLSVSVFFVSSNRQKVRARRLSFGLLKIEHSN